MTDKYDPLIMNNANLNAKSAAGKTGFKDYRMRKINKMFMVRVNTITHSFIYTTNLLNRTHIHS